MNSINKQRCPICGANRLEMVGTPQISDKLRNYIKEDYRVFKCKKCDFYFVLPPIEFSNKDWEGLYNQDYFEDMTEWHINQRRRDRKKRLDDFQKHASQEEIKFLDVGCGNGDVMIDAVVRKWNVHGLDISDNRRTSAKTKDISFFLGDIYQAKFKDDYFDCVYMDSVLEHVNDPLAYLKEINRIMKDDGVLYIGVPNEDSLFNGIKKILYFVFGKKKIAAKLKPFITPYHINGFTKKALNILALKSNFRVLQLRDFAGQCDFLKFKVLSKPFIINVLLLPVHIVAMLMRKQIYLEAIFRKGIK